MTRQELEELCDPLSPEDALDELQLIYNGYGGDDNPLPGMVAIKATIAVLQTLIEEILELPPSVKARRMIY